MKNATEVLERLKYPEQVAGFMDESLQHTIDTLRSTAVSAGNQAEATECWRAETILSIQRTFSDAFEMLRAGAFYDAWCLLERCEIQLRSLLRHHTTDESDPYRIQYVSRLVSQWQSLYPYKVFFSPEIVKKKVVCGICGSVVLPRRNCGHRKHHIYDGRICIHQVVEAEFPSISLVTNPVQKYSVLFLTDDKGQKLDHYNYSAVKFVADRVMSPWHDWRTTHATRELAANEVAHVSASAPCPCCSGKDFSNCCDGKEKLVVPHLQVTFLVPPPPDMPESELYC